MSLAARDFVELTEEVSTNPLWNADLAPSTLASGLMRQDGPA